MAKEVNVSDKDLYKVSLELSPPQRDLLLQLYRDHFQLRDSFFESTPVLKDLEIDDILSIVTPLQETNLVIDSGSSGRLSPSPLAILLTEQFLIPEDPEVARNLQVREDFLLGLALLRETHGPQSTMGLAEMGAPGMDTYEKNVPVEVLMT
jgi:hypothetical protein